MCRFGSMTTTIGDHGTNMYLAFASEKRGAARRGMQPEKRWILARQSLQSAHGGTHKAWFHTTDIAPVHHVALKGNRRVQKHNVHWRTQPLDVWLASNHQHSYNATNLKTALWKWIHCCVPFDRMHRWLSSIYWIPVSMTEGTRF